MFLGMFDERERSAAADVMKDRTLTEALHEEERQKNSASTVKDRQSQILANAGLGATLEADPFLAMPAIGDTRNGGGAVFQHRDRAHFNQRGEAKRPMTQTEAQEYVTAYNASLVGREKHRRRLMWYVCGVCHQVHVGHAARC